jgi:phosphoserine phosphatase RsbU/P
LASPPLPRPPISLVPRGPISAAPADRSSLRTSLAPRDRRRFGLLLRLEDYGYQHELILGAHEHCQTHGVHLFCFGGDLLSSPNARNSAYALSTQVRLDGVAIALGTLGANAAEPDAQALIARFGSTPVCLIGASARDRRSVSVDNLQACYELTRHLIQAHGRRRLAFIWAKNVEAQARFEGFQRALSEARLPLRPEWVLRGDLTQTSGSDAARTLLETPNNLPDAIVAANDWMALGVLQIFSRKGIDVPGRVAVVGFDDIEDARFCSPPLTTARQSARQLGHAAIAALLDQTEPQRFEASLQLRQSCGCGDTRRDNEAAPTSNTEALLSALGKHREEWIQALVSVAPPTEGELPADWAELLVDALLLDLQEGTANAFTTRVDRFVKRSIEYGSAAPWHRIVSRLREESLIRLVGARDRWLSASGLFERAQLNVSSVAEAAQAERRLRAQALQRTLSSLGTQLNTALDRETIRHTLITRLPELNVKNSYVCTYRDAPPAPGAGYERAQLLVAFDRDRGSLAAHEREFDTVDLFPAELWTPGRHSLLVQPLFSDEQALGYCALTLQPQEQTVGQVLPGLLSSALKATALSEALVAEVARRQDAEHARLSEEMRIAASIQTAMLPRSPALENLEIAGVMHPASEVGGDYYDVLPQSDGGWLGIGDVAGHGLHTGLIMLMIQSIVATAVQTHDHLSASELWALTNRMLCNNVRGRLGREEHATLTLLRYRLDGSLEFSGAHEDLIVYRAATRQCELVETPGIWAGVRADAGAAASGSATLQLAAGDLLVLHTDGVTEATNAEDEAFGIDRLLEAVVNLAAEPATRIAEQLLAQVRQWTHDQRDDATLVVARYLGSTKP